MKRIIRGLLHKLDRMLEDKPVYDALFLCIKDVSTLDKKALAFTKDKKYKAFYRLGGPVICSNQGEDWVFGNYGQAEHFVKVEEESNE